MASCENRSIFGKIMLPYVGYNEKSARGLARRQAKFKFEPLREGLDNPMEDQSSIKNSCVCVAASPAIHAVESSAAPPEDGYFSKV